MGASGERACVSVLGDPEGTRGGESPRIVRVGQLDWTQLENMLKAAWARPARAPVQTAMIKRGSAMVTGPQPQRRAWAPSPQLTPLPPLVCPHCATHCAGPCPQPSPTCVPGGPVLCEDSPRPHSSQSSRVASSVPGPLLEATRWPGPVSAFRGHLWGTHSNVGW